MALYPKSNLEAFYIVKYFHSQSIQRTKSTVGICCYLKKEAFCVHGHFYNIVLKYSYEVKV